MLIYNATFASQAGTYHFVPARLFLPSIPKKENRHMANPKPDPARYEPRPDLPPHPWGTPVGIVSHTVNGTPAYTVDGVVYTMTPTAQAALKLNQQRGQNPYGWKFKK